MTDSYVKRATNYRAECVMSHMNTMPHLYRSFSAKEHVISGSFAENDLQLKASYVASPP